MANKLLKSNILNINQSHTLFPWWCIVKHLLLHPPAQLPRSSIQYEVATLSFTQTHVIAQLFYGPLSKIALPHKKRQVFSSTSFFPRQLKANLIRINYISCGLQGFKQCLFNLIFFLAISNPHMKVVALSNIWPRETECVSESLCFCVFAYTCISVLSTLRLIWWQRDSVITPAVSEWRSLSALQCQFTPGSDPDWYSVCCSRAKRSWPCAVWSSWIWRTSLE